MRIAQWSPVACLLFLGFSCLQKAEGQELSKCDLEIGTALTTCPGCSTSPNAFLVRSYQGCMRCLDYTPNVVGSQVFLNECRAAHPIVVEELADGKHTVVLHAGTKIIGAKIPPGLTNTTGNTPPGLPSTTEYPLVLQNPVLSLAPNQHFALDGDSIILSSSMPEPPSSPVLVAKIQNARGAVGAPIVVGARNLADNEFWDFFAIDLSGRDPTNGFVAAGDADSLTSALASATPGTVIRVTSSITAPGPFYIGAPGVTIRGGRRATDFGTQVMGKNSNAFEVQADYARITGLRLRGNSRSTDEVNPALIGVNITPTALHTCDPATPDCPATDLNPDTPSFGVIVDHNDISDWPDEAIAVEDVPFESRNACVALRSNAPFNAFVARNFIHHNEMANDGYGVLADSKVMILGNTFLLNRHAIASGGEAHSSYTAWFNLVLSNTPSYGTFGGTHEQDFDMHGTASDKGSGYGGIAGSELDIGWNTFLGGNRTNFEIRGYPCARDYFHDNVSEHSLTISDGGNENSDQSLYSYFKGVIQVKNGNFPASFPAPYVPQPYPQGELWVFGNQWASAYTDPTAKLQVGDFDGDGLDDLFLATGTAWYFSPGGKAEWRFLSAKPEKVDQLLFGDFDGDGRTDVVTIKNGQFVVSWGGISDWEVLNSRPTGGNLLLLPGAVADMTVGDFDGDGLADIFFSDGQTWWVSYGGNTVFMPVATSSYRVKDLRFGDFNGDGTTDVFGVVSGNWMVSYSPAHAQGVFSSWQFLRSRLTDTVQNLVVADFDGDGIADVGTNCYDFLGGYDGCWNISYGGVSGWASVNQPVPLVGSDLAGIGHFLGQKEADVLSWNIYGFCDAGAATDEVCIAVGAITPMQRYSTQEMR